MEPSRRSGPTSRLGNDPQAVAAGDLNGDGIPDLAVVNVIDGNVAVYLGNGNGTFQAPKLSTVQTNPLAVVIGDFNLDGKPDLAVANGPTNTVDILLGKWRLETFLAATNFPATVTDANALAVADFNGDGKPDLAVTGLTGSTLGVFLGVGDGTFTAAPSSPYTVGTNPTSVAVFNLSGVLSLAVTNGTSNNLSILLGNGNGTFQAAVNYPIGSNTTPVSVAVGDFNGDGVSDLVTANYASNNVSLFYGNSNGTFQTAQNYGAPVVPAGGGCAGDFRGTGRADLAVPNQGGSNVSVLLAAIPLQFYPLTPCRIADTRASQPFTGAFGPPSLAGNSSRTFPILFFRMLHSFECSGVFVELHRGSPSAAGLPPLQSWPSGSPSFPGVSTLNSTDGSVIANAAIVPAGTSGSIIALASNPTDLIIDINGYFALPGSSGWTFSRSLPAA